MGWFDTNYFETPGWFMPYSITDIVRSAMRSIGAIATGETLTDAELQDGTEALNLMISMWSAKGMPVFAATQEDLTLTIAKASYTIGVSGTPDFSTGRPMKILKSTYIRLSGDDSPIEIIGKERYNSFSLKTSGGQPAYLFYDTTYPLGIIYLYPTPDTAYTLHLSSIKQLSQFSDPTHGIAMPPEYYAALKWNLAVDLCPEYEREPSQVVVMRAKESYQAIVELNASNILEPAKLGFGRSRASGENIYHYG